MGYAGIVLHRGAVIGFGDSKETFFVHGVPREDKARGRVCRVSANENFVAVIYGDDVYADGNGAPAGVDRWTAENIEAYAEPYRLLEAFEEEVSGSAENFTRDYRFIFGIKEGYCLQRCSVLRGQIVMDGKRKNQSWKPMILTGGDPYFANDVETARLRNAVKNLDVPDAERLIVRHAENLIASVDRETCYCAAGSPIEVKVLY